LRRTDGHEITSTVILSAAGHSRSEWPAKSKDPYLNDEVGVLTMQRAICEINTGEPMKNPCQARSSLIALASAVLATFFLIACQQSQQQPAPAATESKVASTEKVFVEFRGPWAFVSDPKDANSVLAIAPKAKGHRDLYVQASNQSTLSSGVYELSLPARSGLAAATADPSIAQAKIDAQNLQRALDNKSARYVIRIPKPDEYVVSGRSRSRLGTSYPPDASTEKDYATAVALRYNVSSRNGFSLSGAPDNGAFNPLLFQVENPNVRFVIAPAEEDDPRDKCDTHSRESFHQLTMLLGLTLYVDFPDNPGDCRKNDPQNAHPAKAEGSWRSPLGQIATIEMRTFEQRLLAVVYYFDHPSGDCKAPIVLLTATP
jgi:hypothetical protein